MGNKPSTPIPLIEPSTSFLRSFVGGSIDKSKVTTLVVQHEQEFDEKFEIKRSVLSNTQFVTGMDHGLFSKIDIPEDTVLFDQTLFDDNDCDCCPMNDPLFDQRKLLLNVKTDQEMYDAWFDLYQTYYNEEKAQTTINVMMKLCLETGKVYFCSIKPINKGDELLRCYGFPSWFHEAIDAISFDTLGGFRNFLNDFITTNEILKTSESYLSMFQSHKDLLIAIDQLLTKKHILKECKEINLSIKQLVHAEIHGWSIIK